MSLPGEGYDEDFKMLTVDVKNKEKSHFKDFKAKLYFIFNFKAKLYFVAINVMFKALPWKQDSKLNHGFKFNNF